MGTWMDMCKKAALFSVKTVAKVGIGYAAGEQINNYAADQTGKELPEGAAGLAGIAGLYGVSAIGSKIVSGIKNKVSGADDPEVSNRTSHWKGIGKGMAIGAGLAFAGWQGVEMFDDYKNATDNVHDTHSGDLLQMGTTNATSREVPDTYDKLDDADSGPEY